MSMDMSWKLKWMRDFDKEWDAMSPIERNKAWVKADSLIESGLASLTEAAFYYALRDGVRYVPVTEAGAEEYEEIMSVQEIMEGGS